MYSYLHLELRNLSTVYQPSYNILNMTLVAQVTPIDNAKIGLRYFIDNLKQKCETNIMRLQLCDKIQELQIPLASSYR